MTTSLTKPAAHVGVWNTMPGWGIVGDLTPPEIVAIRKLRLLRRLTAVALALVVVACALGYVYALRKSSAAADDATAVSNQTLILQGQQSRYAGAKQIQAVVGAAQNQVATALTSDVDVAKFTAQVRAALPPSMAIENLSLTITPGAATAPTGGLDVSGAKQIGSVTLSGSAQRLTDLPAFVDALALVPGVINVVPTSNQQSGRLVQWSATFEISTVLYSHHYDIKPGAK